jgi:hypothetical protein
MLRLITLLICLTLVGCATDRKRAREFMESSKWEMARVYWGKVLQDDPSDEEALKGAEQAEFNLTSELSVKVRDNRISGNIYGALEAGIKLFRLHKKWGRTKTDVDMSRFRKKEFMALYPHYLKAIKRSITLKRPLKGSFDLENFQILFTGLGKGELIGLRKKINIIGKKQCLAYKNKGLSYPYWRLFIKKHCDYYRVNISKSHAKSAKIGKDLIGKINKMTGYGSTHSRKFSGAFTDAFRDSLWYNPFGKGVANFRYNGNFNNFTDAETGKKYKTYQQDGVEKTFEYTVIWKIQKLSIDTDSSLQILGRDYPIFFQKEEERRDYSYEGNGQNPYIASRTAKMLSPNTWIAKQSDAYKQKVSDRLREIWIAHTCKRALEQSSMLKQGDLGMRCSLAQDPYYQNTVDAWFAKNFSVTESQAKFVLKF